MLTAEELEGLFLLRKHGTQGEWHFNGNEIVTLENPRVGIAGAMSEIDCQLIAEAISAIDNLRTLQQQNRQLVEALNKGVLTLKKIERRDGLNSYEEDALIDLVELLKSIQGESHDH